MALPLFFATSVGATEYVTEPWTHVGNQIRRSSVEGYQFSYHLIRLGEGTEAKPGAATHHLMLFIMAPNGAMVTDAEVTVRIDDEAGREQKETARQMTSGFGVDLLLRKEGVYKFRAAVVDKGVSLTDAFEFRFNRP